MKALFLILFLNCCIMGNELINAIEEESQNYAAYNPFVVAGKGINAATNPYDSYINPKQRLIYNLAQSFLGGMAGGYGANQVQDFKTQKYNELANQIEPGRASSTIAKSLFDIDQSLSDKTAQRELDYKLAGTQLLNNMGNTQEAAKIEMMQNPSFRKKLLGLPEEMSAEVAQTPAQKIAANMFGTSVKSKREQEKEFYSDFISQGYTPAQASQSARTLAKELGSLGDVDSKKLTETRDKIRNADTLLGSVESAMQRAGDTGGFSGRLQPLQRLGVGFIDSERATAMDELATNAADFVSQAKVAGSGAMSDREMEMYQKSGISAKNEPEVNKALLDKFKNVNQVNKDYLDFLDTYQAQTGTLDQAESAWQKYLDANPIYIKDPSGNVGINSNRPHWSKWFQSQSQAPQAEQAQPQQDDQFSLLLDAVKSTESNGNSNAVSPKGAIGAYQFMIPTAREEMKKLGYPVEQMPDEEIAMVLRDESQARDIAGSHLQGLLKQFGGDKEKALAAYNAGAGAVKKYGGIPPFKETQNYVPKVLGKVREMQGGQPQDVAALIKQFAAQGLNKQQINAKLQEVLG